MRTSTTKKSVSKETNLVFQLIQCGYSEAKAVNLYNKYKNWNKLNQLQEYVDTKLSTVPKYDSFPLRDM